MNPLPYRHYIQHLKKKLRFALVPFLSLQNKSTFKVAHVSRIKKSHTSIMTTLEK